MAPEEKTAALLDLCKRLMGGSHLAKQYTPDEWTPEQRRREDRRDAGLAFLIIASLLVALIGGGMVLVALIEGKL